MMQGIWCYLISLPTLFLNASPAGDASLSAMDVAALAGFALGIALEVNIHFKMIFLLQHETN